MILTKKQLYICAIVIIIAIVIAYCCYKCPIAIASNTQVLDEKFSNFQANVMEANVQPPEVMPHDITGFVDGTVYDDLGKLHENPGEISDLAIKTDFANMMDAPQQDYKMLEQPSPIVPVPMPENKVMVEENIPVYNLENRSDSGQILQTQSDYYLLDDGGHGEYALDNNKCSKSCCGTNNWPVPFYTNTKENDGYLPTNMFCSNSVSSGCLCATPKQVNHLRTRGGNAPLSN